MRTRGAFTPSALVVLAASTAAYAYFVDRGKVSDADREARRRDVFPSFRVEQVKRIELVHGAETTVLERGAGGAWRMLSPLRGPTDAAAVDSLLRELEMAPRLREVDERDAVGLDAPRVRGKVAVGPLAYAFELGAAAPQPEGAAYMRVDGEGTFVAGRSLTVQLLRGADAYRDRTIVPYGAGEIARLEVVEQDGGGFVLARHGASFRVGGGGGLRASRSAVDRVFGALADAKADGFLSDAAADGAATARALAVTVTPSAPGAPRIALRLGGECPSEPDDVVAVRTAPTRVAACVARRVEEALSAGAEALVDEGPFSAHADEMEEIALEPVAAGGARVDLARRGEGWHERSPQDRDLSPGEVDAANVLALALASGQASSVHPPDPGESFVPRSRATVFRAGGAPPEVVEVGAPDASGIAVARRDDDGALLRLDRALARRLEPHPAALRSLDAARLDADPGAVVAVDDTCSAAPERLDLAGGSWKARPPAGAKGAAFAVDAVAVTDMLGALSRARAGAWLAEADDGTFGLDRSGACSVTLTVGAGPDGGARQVGMTFGAAGPQGKGEVYARDLGDPAVFAAPAVLREIASHPAVDRGRFRIDAAALSGVTLARGDARLVLARGGDGRLARAGGPPDAGEDDKLVAALAGLYAQSALHTGPPAGGEGFDAPILEIDATTAADAGPPRSVRLTFGSPARESAVDGYFARASGVDATFLVPRRQVDAILDAW